VSGIFGGWRRVADNSTGGSGEGFKIQLNWRHLTREKPTLIHVQVLTVVYNALLDNKYEVH